MITLTVSPMHIYLLLFISTRKDISKMAAGDYSNGKGKLITLTVFTIIPHIFAVELTVFDYFSFRKIAMVLPG